MDDAAEGIVPPFDAKGCRYDQSTYAGRLRRFREMTDPRMLLISDDELAKARCPVLSTRSPTPLAGVACMSMQAAPLTVDASMPAPAQAQSLLDKHAKGQACNTTDAQLWEAKRIKDAIVHPVTGEKMFLPGRMSAFVPVNTIPTVGMLLATTPAQTVFWQWVNQSLNVICNYVNRSGATIDTTQVACAYGLAVGVSCSIAVGARRLVESGPPWVRRLSIAVPYAAVVTAGAANVAFTRLPEMRDGVPITAPDGTPLGTSKAAAQSAVVNTVLSRIMLQPIAPMLFPPLMYAALRSVVPLGTIGGVVAQTAFVAGCSGCALPVAIAFFPQVRAPRGHARPPGGRYPPPARTLVSQTPEGGVHGAA